MHFWIEKSLNREVDSDEHHQEGFFDETKEDADLGDSTQTRAKLAEEEEVTEEPALPGATSDERARMDARLRLPRPARAAMRRMHIQFGHVKKGRFMEILKATKCPAEYLGAGKHFRCEGCDYMEKIPFPTSQGVNAKTSRPQVAYRCQRDGRSPSCGQEECGRSICTS